MKYHEVTARGTGNFPLDMLRFGRCWPKDIESVLAMEPLSNEDILKLKKDGSQREVTVCMNGSYIQAHAVMTRFESFGWIAEITHEE